MQRTTPNMPRRPCAARIPADLCRTAAVWRSTGGTVPGDDCRHRPDCKCYRPERAQDRPEDREAAPHPHRPEAGGIDPAGDWPPAVWADLPVAVRESVDSPEPQPDVFPAAGHGGAAARFGAVSGAPRMRHERSAGKRVSNTPAGCWGTRTSARRSGTCTLTTGSLLTRRIWSNRMLTGI